MAGGYGADFYKSIQLGIETTGQAGVNDLGSTVAALKQELSGYQNQLKAGAPLNQQMVADIGRTTAELKRAEAAYAAAQRVIKGLPADLAAYNAQLKQQAQAQADAAKSAQDNAARTAKALADAAEAQKLADGDAMRARIDAYARAERAQEAADRAAKQAAGDAQRARIDAYARADAAAMASAAAQKKAAADVAATQKQAADQAAAAAARAANTQVDAARRSSRGWTQASIEISRLFEDVSVAGPLGGLNNVGRVFSGIAQAAGLAAPQVAAVETVASTLATTGYLLYQNWDKVKGLFDDGLGPKLLPDLEQLRKELDELKKAGPVTLVEVADIQRAERAVELAERIAAARKAQQAQTEEDRKQAEFVNKGIVESTGGQDNKLVDLIVGSRANESSPELRAIRKEFADRLAAARASDAGTGTDFFESDFRSTYQQSYADREAAQKLKDAQNRRAASSDLLGLAGSGDEAARAELARILRGNRQAGLDKGIDVDKLLGAIGQADAVPKGYTKEGEQAAKKAAEDAKKEAKEEADAQALLEKTQREGAGRLAEWQIKGDARVAKEQHDAIMKGADAARQGAEQREALAAQAAKPFEADVEGYLAGNELTYHTTGRVARSRRQERQFADQGLAYAVPSAEAQRRAADYVGSQLAATGGDPTLAGGAVSSIVGKLGEDVRQGIAQGNSQTATLIGIVGAVQSKVDRALAEQQRNWAAIGMLRTRQSRQAGQMPSLVNF